MWFISILRRKQVNVIYQSIKTTRCDWKASIAFEYRGIHHCIKGHFYINDQRHTLTFAPAHICAPKFISADTEYEQYFLMCFFVPPCSLTSTKWKDEWPFCTVRYHFKPLWHRFCYNTRLVLRHARTHKQTVEKNSGPAFLCDNNCVTLLKVTWFFVLYSFLGLDVFREQKTTTTTFLWHFEIMCSFYVLFISFHSIPLQSTLFVVFGGRKWRKKVAIFTHFGGQSAVTPLNKAIFSCIPNLKQNQVLLFLSPSSNDLSDDDDQRRFFIGFKFNKKMHFFLSWNWARVLGNEIYEHTQKFIIHSIGPTSCGRHNSHSFAKLSFWGTLFYIRPALDFIVETNAQWLMMRLKSVYMWMWLQFVHDFTDFIANFDKSIKNYSRKISLCHT